MRTYSIQMLPPFLAVGAQFEACSAVIKEIKIQTSVTKTRGFGFSTKINTQPHQSLQIQARILTHTSQHHLTVFPALVWRNAEKQHSGFNKLHLLFAPQ